MPWTVSKFSGAHFESARPRPRAGLAEAAAVVVVLFLPATERGDSRPFSWALSARTKGATETVGARAKVALDKAL